MVSSRSWTVLLRLSMRAVSWGMRLSSSEVMCFWRVEIVF